MKRFLIFSALTAVLCFFCTGCGQPSPENTAQQVTVQIKPGVNPPDSEKTESAAPALSSVSPEETTFVDANGETVRYTDVLIGECTAYSGHSQTAAGITPEVGVVAVDPYVIPYGTRLYITAADGSYTYGYCVAGDTGQAMADGSALCDLYMDTAEECDAFGRREMIVYLLEDDSEE